MNRSWSSLPDLRALAAARGTQQKFISANDHDRAWSSLPDLHPESNDASNSYRWNPDSTCALPEITENLGIPGAYKFLDDEAQRPSQADIAVGNDLKQEALTNVNVNTAISLAIECAVRAYQPEQPITLRHPGRPGVAAPKVVDNLTQSSSDDAQVSRIALFEHQHAEASSSHSKTEAKVTLVVAVVGLDLPEDLKEEHIFNAVDGRCGAETKTFQPVPVDIIESPLLHPRGQPMLVHRRFMGAAAKIVDRVASAIRSACSDSDTSTALLVTGHSSGGAIASLVLRLLCNHHAMLMSKFAGHIRLVTFGSPPVIASHHEHLFKPAEARCQAFMAQGDAVTFVRSASDRQLALPEINTFNKVLSPMLHETSRLAQTVALCPVGQLVKIEQHDLFESTLRQVDLRSWSSMTPPDPWHPQSHSIVSYWLLIQSLDTSRWTPRASALFSEASPLSSDALREDSPDFCGTSALSQLQSVNADEDMAILYVDIAKLHPAPSLSGSSVRIPLDVLTWFSEEGIAKTISAFELRHLACVQAAVLPVTYNPVSALLGSPCIYLYGNAASKEHRDFAKWLTTSGFPVLLRSYALAPPSMLTTATSKAPTISRPAGARVSHTGGETTSTAGCSKNQAGGDPLQGTSGTAKPELAPQAGPAAPEKGFARYVSTLELDRGDLAPQQRLMVGPRAPSNTCPLRPQLCGPTALQSKQIFQFQGILEDDLTKRVKYKWMHMLTVIPGLRWEALYYRQHVGGVLNNSGSPFLAGLLQSTPERTPLSERPVEITREVGGQLSMNIGTALVGPTVMANLIQFIPQIAGKKTEKFVNGDHYVLPLSSGYLASSHRVSPGAEHIPHQPWNESHNVVAMLDYDEEEAFLSAAQVQDDQAFFKLGSMIECTISPVETLPSGNSEVVRNFLRQGCYRAVVMHETIFKSVYTPQRPDELAAHFKIINRRPVASEAFEEVEKRGRLAFLRDELPATATTVGASGQHLSGVV